MQWEHQSRGIGSRDVTGNVVWEHMWDPLYGMG
jgi:hypothetical protein